jgi:CheY-like chemotaxis protein
MRGPVLFVGRADRHEFRPIIERLRAAGTLILAINVNEALEAIDQCPAVARIVLAPAFRQEFPDAQLHQLLRRQPLANWCLLVGPWLEGETRSGRPWVGARRLYLDQAIAELSGGASAAWATDASPPEWIPATLSPEERWLWRNRRPATASGCALVCGELAESRQSVAAVCAAAGLSVVSHAPEQTVELTGVDSVIYDAVAARDRWREHIVRLARRQPRSLVVLVNFPRPDEVQWMLAAGATAVLGKPFRIDDLQACVTRDA